MRIAIVTESYSANAGGGSTFVNSLINTMPYSSKTGDTYVSLLRTSRLRVKSGSSKLIYFSPVLFRRLGAFLATLPKVRKLKKFLNFSVLRLIRKEKFDLVIFIGCEPEILEIPFGVFVWDLQHRLFPYLPEYRGDDVWFSRERFYATSLRRAGVVITGTKTGKEQIEYFYQVNPQNIIICPHPVPYIDKLPSAKPQRKDFLFYPAQFWSHKNHSLIVEAYAKLVESGCIPPKMIFVGSDKGNRQFVEALVNSKNLSQFFEFKGFVTNEEILELYLTASAMVYPSLGGPENLPPLEALALNCPVIYADFPGAREQLKSSVRYFDPLSSSDLAKKLIEHVQESQNVTGSTKSSDNEFAGSDVPEFFENLSSQLLYFVKIKSTWS